MCPNTGCPAWGKHRKVPPAGGSFFQPFEANFVENLRTPGVLRPQNRLGGEKSFKIPLQNRAKA